MCKLLLKAAGFATVLQHICAEKYDRDFSCALKTSYKDITCAGVATGTKQHVFSYFETQCLFALRRLVYL